MSKTPSVQDEIDALTADVAAQTTVVASAVTFIKGVPALVAAAVAAANAAGPAPLTPAQLAAFTSLQTSLTGETSDLTAALTTNTPA